MNITSLSYCESKHFLICSSKEGYFSVYDMGRPGKEKNTNLISLQKTFPNQSLDFSLSAKEIYVNYNNNVVILESINLKNLCK